MKKILKILSKIIVSFISIVIVFILTLGIYKVVTKKDVTIFGYYYSYVLTDSMDGDKNNSFKQGNIIILKKLDNNEKYNLKKEDIISFEVVINDKKITNTHRIRNIDNNLEKIQTYSDKSLLNDNYKISFDDVKSIYIKKSFLSFFSRIFLDYNVMFIFIILILIIILIMNIIKIIKYYNEKNLLKQKEEFKKEVLKEMSEKNEKDN